jgi:hypothetical protein
MDRRKFLVLVTAFSLSGTVPALADNEDDIIERLIEAGFGQIEVTRTLLGRVRIVAFKGSIRRELVINPRTGEILRDVTLVAEGGKSSNGGKGSSNGSGSGDDDGGDDDRDDDDNDDDDDHGGGSDDGGDDSDDD